MAASKDIFKQYLKKIGSGQETGKALNRVESAKALKLMLNLEATPAQIGAFMIAHRIRRPEPEELAGMLDTYLELGPEINTQHFQKRPICFGMPFDGREKTSPIYPLTVLLLLSAGQPVVLHAGKRMPVKYGVTTTELFNSLGLRLEGITLDQLQQGFNQHGLALIYQPDHFKLAENLIKYRDEIGKRPPLASMELLWNCHHGDHLIVTGFVHAPTEKRAMQTLNLLGEKDFILVKGLEGGIDLPINRICLTGRSEQIGYNRLILKPKEYNYFGEECNWENIEVWQKKALEILDNKGPLKESVHWNGGVYYWLSGITSTINEGIEKVDFYLNSGIVKKTLAELIRWRNGL